MFLDFVLLFVTTAAVVEFQISASHERAHAQGEQPGGKLFDPFWEAWGLLHENYVDPIDDTDLFRGAVTGLLDAADSTHISDEFLVAPPDTTSTTTLFEPFWKVWNVLHTENPALVDDNALMEGALSGMMHSLGDPHTDYMNPDIYARVNESMSGAYEGIGAVVRESENFGGLELVSIMEGSPAEAAGLQPGDVIVEVEGQDVRSLNQNDIIALVRGPAGTDVKLGIAHATGDTISNITVTRQRITVPSVTYKVLDGNIGYVRLNQFEFQTSQEMRDALVALDANHLNGLILDVRANPGGYLTTAIDVASAYIAQGPIVTERGPQGDHTYEALGNPVAPDVPMVVLVDQGSASASELISGALQDTGRATIVGTQTFGKGSVQTWRELSNGGAVRITIARWYTPEGHSVNDVGITPDIEVTFDPNQPEGQDNQIDAAVQVLEGQPVTASAS